MLLGYNSETDSSLESALIFFEFSFPVSNQKYNTSNYVNTICIIRFDALSVSQTLHIVHKTEAFYYAAQNSLLHLLSVSSVFYSVELGYLAIKVFSYGKALFTMYKDTLTVPCCRFRGVRAGFFIRTGVRRLFKLLI